MKEKIIKLRQMGKTYREICKQLHCSKSLIAYYINPMTKNKMIANQRLNRFAFKQQLKALIGNKCICCGYSKCAAALHFHHLKPSKKKFEITEAIWSKVKVSQKEIIKEVKKCVLLCANCHAEYHAGIISLTSTTLQK